MKYTRIVPVLMYLSVLTGCATAHNQAASPSSLYAQKYHSKAQSGDMKWSDYYKGLYANVNTERNLTTGDELMVLNGLIGAAQDYEDNKITLDQFESKRREAQATLTKAASDYSLKQAEIEASRPAPEPYVYQAPIRAKRPPLETFKAPRQTNCSTYGNQTSCTTY
jgi:hypothetical protein